MNDFFANLPFDKASELAQLSRLILELRNNRNAILGHHRVPDEAALLARIESGAIAEHPAWEHCLAARILADTREAARNALAASLKAEAGAAPSVQLELAALVDEQFAAALAAPVKLRQDALVIVLANGLTVTVRYSTRDTYSLRWTRDGAECGIDTAPLHPTLATFPNHFHDAAGRILADPLTDPAADPADNLTNVLRTLLAQPGFGLEAGH